LSDPTLAFVFPAFTYDFTDHPGWKIDGFRELLIAFLQQSCNIHKYTLTEHSFFEDSLSTDELKTQYLTYIFSCAASAALRKNGWNAGVNAGYSMGIYASLFDAGAISFETGLILIKIAYQTLSESLHNERFGMVTLIGLDRSDILQLTDLHSFRVEIANQNAPHSFVVSGAMDDLAILVNKAKDEGVLHSKFLHASIPYHSRLLFDAAQKFKQLIKNLDITEPRHPVISLIDQSYLSTPESVRKELVNNLFKALNWNYTMQALLSLGITRLIECGADSGLVKNSKFVAGNYQFKQFGSMDAFKPL